MAAADRLLARMKRTAGGWSPDDLNRLYTGFGFIVKQGARHTKYRHPDHPEISAVVPRHGELPKAYVRTAVKSIDRLAKLETGNE